MTQSIAASDAEFINQMSEMLFGYREASNEEIYAKVELLLRLNENSQIESLANTKAEALRRISQELADIVNGSE